MGASRDDLLVKGGWRETGCSAILVQNDVAAIGVIQILQKEGIKVTEEVSVMGFDGTGNMRPDFTSCYLCRTAY